MFKTENCSLMWTKRISQISLATTALISCLLRICLFLLLCTEIVQHTTTQRIKEKKQTKKFRVAVFPAWNVPSAWLVPTCCHLGCLSVLQNKAEERATACLQDICKNDSVHVEKKEMCEIKLTDWRKHISLVIVLKVAQRHVFLLIWLARCELKCVR